MSEYRDISAAKRFFTGAVELHCAPETIALDGHLPTRVAIAELKNDGALRPETKGRTSKYLNNLVEQDDRRVKQRIYPVLGFKSFGDAAVSTGGVEPTQEMGKGQFDTSAATTRDGARVPQVRDVVLAA